MKAVLFTAVSGSFYIKSLYDGLTLQMTHYIQKCQDNLLDILDEKQGSQDDGFDIVP